MRQRDDMGLEYEWCTRCSASVAQDERVHIRERHCAQASNAAHHSLSHVYIFSVSLQAVDTTAF